MRAAIIGGSSAIGRAVTDRFVARGDRVLATYDKHPLAGSEGVVTARLDLRDDDSITDFARTAEGFGGLDAVVILAAVLPGLALADYDLTRMNEVMAVNVTGTARLIQGLIAHMREGGHMLLMSSISGERGSFDPLYAASKAALSGLVKSLATRHGRRCRFNCLAPSLVEGSGMFLAMEPARREHHRDATPTGSLLALGDLAAVIADLTQPHWRHLNGAVVRLNGGEYV